MIKLPKKCLRGKNTCEPYAQIKSDHKPISFICCGVNDGSERRFDQDKFTVCWKNRSIDDVTHWDERDIKDTMSIMAQALSVDENKKANTRSKKKTKRRK